jgi:hypothetical protein
MPTGGSGCRGRAAQPVTMSESAKTAPRVTADCELLHRMILSTPFAGDNHWPEPQLAQRLKGKCNVSPRVTLGMRAQAKRPRFRATKGIVNETGIVQCIANE